MCDSSIAYNVQKGEIQLMSTEQKNKEFSNFQDRVCDLFSAIKQRDFSAYSLDQYIPLKMQKNPKDPRDPFALITSTAKADRNEKNEKLTFSIIEKLIQNISRELKEVKITPIHTEAPDHSKLTITYSGIVSIVDTLIAFYQNCQSNSKTKKQIIKYIRDKCAIETRSKNRNETDKKIDEFGTIKTITISLFPKDFIEEHKPKISRNVIALFILFFRSLFSMCLEVNFDLNVYLLNKLYIEDPNPYKITPELVHKNVKEHKEMFLANCIIIEGIVRSLQQIKITMYDSYQREIHNIFSEEYEKTQKVINNNTISQSYLQTDTNTMSSMNNTFSHLNTSIGNTPDGDLSSSYVKINYAKDQTFTRSYTGNVSEELSNMLMLLNCLYYDQLPAYELSFDINTLDPLLFSNMNNIIYRNKNCVNLKLNFFPEGRQVNIRKILINKNYFNYYFNNGTISDDPIYNIQECFFTISNSDIERRPQIEKKVWLLKEEKVLRELYDYFNLHLFDLSIIIGTKLESLMNLSLNFSFSSNSDVYIRNYDTYNASLICFLFNLFQAIQSNRELKLGLLEISLDDPNNQNLTLIRQLKTKFFKFANGFNFSNTFLTQINFNITNISELISYENYPCNTLMTLILRNLSEKDFTSLIQSIDKNNDLFKALTTLEISLDFMQKIPLDKIKHFIKKCITPKIESLTIELNQNVNIEIMMKMLFWIREYKRNKSKVNFVIKIACDGLSQFVGTPSFPNYSFATFRIRLNQTRELYCEASTEKLMYINVKLKTLPASKLNCYLAFVYCFTKKLQSKQTKMKKVYKKIMYMMGGLEPTINVRFEIKP